MFLRVLVFEISSVQVIACVLCKVMDYSITYCFTFATSCFKTTLIFIRTSKNEAQAGCS